jgi:hypothetical protein
MLLMEIFKYRVNENTITCAIWVTCSVKQLMKWQVNKELQNWFRAKTFSSQGRGGYGRQLGPTSCKQSCVENKHNGTYHTKLSIQNNI